MSLSRLETFSDSASKKAPTLHRADNSAKNENEEQIDAATPASGHHDVLPASKADAHAVEVAKAKPAKRGVFSWWKADSAEEDVSEKEALPSSEGNVPAAPPVEVIPESVSFTQLFRFSTPFELTIDFVGLIAASAAGSAQPLMSIIFGNLTQSFVSFGTAVMNFHQGSGTQAQVDAAAAHFRHDAASDAAIIVYIGLGMFASVFTYMYFWVYTAEVNSKRIRERYLKAILRQDIAYFDSVGAGEVTSRIQTDTHLVQQGMSEKVAIAAQSIASFITGFVVAYVRSWRLALALSSIIPCMGITGALMNKFETKYMQLELKHVAEGGAVAEEVISTIRTAQAFGTQKVLSALYDIHIQQSHVLDLKLAIVQGVSLSIFFFVIYSAYALAFSFGTTLLIHGHADVGIVVNVFMAILIGSFGLTFLVPQMESISHGRAAAAKLFATIDRIPAIDSEDPSGLKPEKVVGEITLEHVKFNYPSRPDVPIIKDLSITFPAGKTAAIVGASGSGKSTIVSLVERFYDPLSGAVKLGGVDMRELNVKWLRRQIGLVSQEPVLFATTIKGNVSHGLIGTEWEHASEEEQFKLIKEACIKANADGFISKLPLGYETLVGERGFLLSGGQKQRVAIARAIVSDPRILLLDEATSALDTQSEGIVQDALDKASAGRTTIIIAHRLSTIKNAERIFVMDAGEVIEEGSHASLLAIPNGAYARLVQTQRLRDEDEKRAADGDITAEEIDPFAVSEKDDQHNYAAEALDEIPLGQRNTRRSMGSEIIEKKQKDAAEDGEGGNLGMIYLCKRMGMLQGEVWKSYFVGSIFAAFTGMAYPAFGIVYAISISTFQIQDHHILRHKGDRNALWFFVIAILTTIGIGVQNYTFMAAAANLTYRLRVLSFKAILRQDIEFFDQDKNSTGALTSSLSDNPQKINGLAGVTLGFVVQSTATVIAGIIIGLAFQWKLALVGIACMPFIISAGLIRMHVVELKDQKNKKMHEYSAQIACEAAGSIRTVASLTREDDFCRIYSESLEEPLKRSNRTALWANLLYALSQSMMFYVIALAFWYGAQGVSKGEYGTTAFFVCLFSVIFGAIQAGNIFSFVPDFSSAQSAGSDIIRLIDSIPEIDAESTEGEVLKHCEGRIRFEDVHFRYPTRPGVRVLRGLNLKVEPGTYVALVGASGCGKSTTIQLIERFYDPLLGKVYLDGQDITKLNIQEYRKHMALVSQEPTLYAGTIRFNILLGATKPHEEVTQEEIEAACRDANILDFINSLPQGFDTNVGSKGSQLSGGQKQRIAIARALLRNPKVLLLDEATSALDSNSEKVVQEALDQAAKGRTTIAIAHRLSTIQNADCIYFVKDGRVSESGTHDQLLARKGDYYEYVQLQALTKK